MVESISYYSRVNRAGHGRFIATLAYKQVVRFCASEDDIGLAQNTWGSSAARADTQRERDC